MTESVVAPDSAINDLIMFLVRRRLSANPSVKVPIDLIKALRMRTGAPIVDCKASLARTGLDVDAAHRHLRTIGLAKANKNRGRQTTQGVIGCAREAFGAVLVELQTETDFVAKNERFLDLADKVARIALVECHRSGTWTNPNLDAIRDRSHDELSDTLLAVRENIVLGAVSGVRLDEGDRLATYIHNRSSDRSNIGQIGVLMRWRGDNHDIAGKVAMHIAATAPICVRVKEIPEDIVEAERAIITDQIATLGKPASVQAGIIQGRLRKWQAEHTLIDQVFALGDGRQRVRDLLTDRVAVVEFVRMRIGESLIL